MIIDSGCDQCIISKNSFIVGQFTGITFDVDGALSDMKSVKPLEIVNKCITCVNFKFNRCKYTKILLELNQCLLDSNPGQSESLLQPHQARAYGVVINDVAKRHLATEKT